MLFLFFFRLGFSLHRKISVSFDVVQFPFLICGGLEVGKFIGLFYGYLIRMCVKFGVWTIELGDVESTQ